MISIVLPTYNRKDLLIDAITSISAQSFKDWELIIVDDGSTDGTYEAIKGHLCSRIHYVHQKNQGVSRARNIGINKSRYDWIAFLDSDDYWHKNKLQYQLETLENNPQYNAIYTDEIWIRSGVRVNQRKHHRKYSGWIFHHCLRSCLISPSSLLLSRDLLNLYGLFDDKLPVCEDYDLWIRITTHQPILYLPEKLIVKRGGHSDQLSKSRWGMDRYRVQSLLKAVDSNLLTPQQEKWVADEIVYKSKILENGFSKRNRLVQAAYYRMVRRRFHSEVSKGEK